MSWCWHLTTLLRTLKALLSLSPAVDIGVRRVCVTVGVRVRARAAPFRPWAWARVTTSSVVNPTVKLLDRGGGSDDDDAEDDDQALGDAKPPERDCVYVPSQPLFHRVRRDLPSGVAHAPLFAAKAKADT